MIIEQKALYQELLAMQSKNKAISIINEIDNSKNIDEKINNIIHVVTLLADSINEITGIINELFIPLGLKPKYFYEYHFGVLGIEETLVIGNMAVY